MSDRQSFTQAVYDWFGRAFGERVEKHVHSYGPWEFEERVYKLYGPYGRTENPAFYNVRVCECGHRQMQRIKDGDE